METIEAIRSLAPLVVDTMGALVAVATALQMLAMGVAKVWPKADAVAHWLGIVAIDMKKATDGAKRLLGKKDASAGATTHITIPPKGDS
jgi:hypothetical protein